MNSFKIMALKGIIFIAAGAFAQASHRHPPAQTIDSDVDPLSWTPAPTPAPENFELVRRQGDDSGRICGYLEGNRSRPLTCSNAYCGFNRGLNAAGCCQSIFTANGVSSLGDCIYRTACYGLYDDYDSSSELNTLNGFCTSPAYPYCFRYELANGGYSGFRCTDSSASPMLTATLLTTFTDGEQPATNTDTDTDALTSSSSASSSKIVSTSSSSPTPTPFSQTQQTAGGGGGAAAATTTTTEMATTSTIRSAADAPPIQSCRFLPKVLFLWTLISSALFFR